MKEEGKSFNLKGVTLNEEKKYLYLEKAKKGTVYSLVIGMLFMIWLPYLWLILTSLQKELHLYSYPPPIFPKEITLEAYRFIFNDAKFVNALYHSLVVSFTTAAICLTAGTLGAYAIARLRFPFRNTLYFSLMIIYMLPGIAMLIPLLIIIRKLGLIDTHLGIILALSAFLLPLVTWFLKGLFEGVPIDLEKAARVDGCTRLQSLIRVILPISSPGIAVTAIFAILTSWNELMFAKVLGVFNIRLVTPAISDWITPYDIHFSELSAGSIVASAPLLIVVLILQRYIIQGLTEGAIK